MNTVYNKSFSLLKIKTDILETYVSIKSLVFFVQNLDACKAKYVCASLCGKQILLNSDVQNLRQNPKYPFLYHIMKILYMKMK